MSLIGIDLGNSNISVAIPDPQGNPVVMPNEVGELYTPSVVYFDGASVPTRTEAANALALDPSRGVANWKRHMGTDTVLCTGPDGKEYRAKDIAEILLRHTAEVYAQKTGKLLVRAAVAVPANYSDPQKEETKRAARSAGIEVTHTPHEPTAAGFGNNLHTRGDGYVALFDLGGGTFDVSVVEVEGKEVKVKATNGDQEFGGQDVNRRLSEVLLDRMEKECGVRPTRESDPVAHQDLMQRIEQVKLSLSARESAPLMLTCGGQAYSTTVTRDDLAGCVKDLLDRAMDLAERTLEESGLEIGDIREILRVGGASQMACFEEAIERRFGRKSSCHTEPFFAVALGTMLVGRLERERAGERFEGEAGLLPPLEVRLQDVTAHPVGVQAQTDSGELVNSVILRKGLPMPSQHKRLFQLAQPGQTDALIRILQGPDAVPADKCQPLGDLELRDLPAVHDKPHKIDIRMLIDTDGVITAVAIDPASGKEKKMKLTYTEKEGEA